MNDHFTDAFIYLCAAVVVVPCAKRLGLGSVLGYLIAGVLIGPVFGLVGNETTDLQHFAEFGVVMMLFLVGLELQPSMLWAMRHRLVGLGGLQVVLTTAAVMLVALALKQTWQVALAIGLIIPLSSTAIVLQTFKEKGLSNTDGGRAAFSVLLLQDIAVIPILALMPMLAQHSTSALDTSEAHHNSFNFGAHLSPWGQTLLVIAVIAALVIAGRYLSRPLLRYVASARLIEIFSAAALMLIIGVAILMNMVGLSPALGTFLAGVVLANSEFKHELESNIEPFKGLLLGLFFITVGAGINFELLRSQFVLIIALSLGLMILKAGILLALSKPFKLVGSDRFLFALSLAQAGEFGFVLLSYALQLRVINPELNQTLSLVVAISMFLTPILFIAYQHLILPHYHRSEEARDADPIDEQGTVIVAGIGRFGQIVNRFLVANDVKTVVLDHQAAQVELMRQINIKSYFGEVTNPQLLITAGIEQAKMIVVAIDDRERVNQVVEYVKHAHPHVKVMARAYDRGHAYELRMRGADCVVTEAYYSALELGTSALTSLGFHPFRAEQCKVAFDEVEKASRDELYQSWLNTSEENSFSTHYRELFIEMERLLGQAMDASRADRHSLSARGWTPPPKNYTDSFEQQAPRKPPQ